jgi:ABC-type nitrate/sulfonate/bicarbonate transport system permease component
MLQVMAPLALPAIMSGLRLGTALIVIAVVLSNLRVAVHGRRLDKRRRMSLWAALHITQP